jgi:hypothetical protein
MGGDALALEAKNIRDSGILGRSDVILRLFDFFVSAGEGVTFREAEVAAALFGPAVAFDASQDARVRVYVHRLRKKLEHYYAHQGADAASRLTIPKGEYRLVVAASEEATPVPRAPFALGALLKHPLAAIALAALVAVNVLGWLAFSLSQNDGLADVRASAPWAALLKDKRPIALVVGDYYILGETDQIGNVDRLVREYDINSPADLDDYLMNHPERMGTYSDLDLYYVPTSAAFAMRSLLPVLQHDKREVRVVLASQLTPAVLKDSDVVYVGYLSGLGMLLDTVFHRSKFEIGETYDELIDRTSQKHFVSHAGGPPGADGIETDFGYVSAFDGPSGNRVLVVAGMRDIGLMQMAEAISDPAVLQTVKAKVGAAPAFEALFQVQGMGRANLSGHLVYGAPLKAVAPQQEAPFPGR